MFDGKRWRQGGLALLLLVGAKVAVAAPPLTLLQDVLYRADGTRFQGVAYIQWQSFEASDTTSIATQNIALRITNGDVRVRLVPTTTASAGAFYQVKYNSNGRTQFVEYWSVPPSQVALRLRDVRIPGPPSGNLTSPPVSSALLIPDVAGLREELDARLLKGPGFSLSRAAVINASGGIDSALGSLDDCLHVDGTSGPCGAGTSTGPVFSDAEVPNGAVDGSNATFTVSKLPSPAISLQLYRNGILQKQNLDYTVSSSTITLTAGSIPGAGDMLLAWYRSGAAGAQNYADAETPSGTLNGVNTTFALSAAPSPAASLLVFRNGVLQKAGADYSLSSATLTFLSGSIPGVGDVLQVFYRF